MTDLIIALSLILVGLITGFLIGRLYGSKKAFKKVKYILDETDEVMKRIEEKEYEIEMRLEFLKYLERETF